MIMAIFGFNAGGFGSRGWSWGAAGRVGIDRRDYMRKSSCRGAHAKGSKGVKGRLEFPIFSV